RAVQRGPLVYCIEEADNKVDFDALRIAENAKFDTAFKADKLRGIVEITAHVGDQTLNYIPYYSWDNREAGKMKVWVPLAD
ncbi:MAG: glycoside hydrolase family 127 protein, partial [Bacteroidales bacterium]|nr:glycoside hydrolase family 127 protein [Bacteroidales bacterium]